MTTAPHIARRTASNLAHEQAASGADFQQENLEERSYQLMSLAAFSLYELTEKKLRGFLKIGGLNLSDPDVFDMASGMASAFVGVNALLVTDLMDHSLIDMRHDFLKNFLTNDALLSLVEDVKFQGIMWRESLLDA